MNPENLTVNFDGDFSWRDFRTGLRQVLEKGACLGLVNYFRDNGAGEIKSEDETIAAKLSLLLGIALTTEDVDVFQAVAPLMGIIPPESRPAFNQTKAVAKNVFKSHIDSELSKAICDLGKTILGIRRQVKETLVENQPKNLRILTIKTAEAKVRSLKATRPEWYLDEDIRRRLAEYMRDEIVDIGGNRNSQLAVEIDRVMAEKSELVDLRLQPLLEQEKIGGKSGPIPDKRLKRLKAKAAKEIVIDDRLITGSVAEIGRIIYPGNLAQVIDEKLADAVVEVLTDMGFVKGNNLVNYQELIDRNSEIVERTRAKVDGKCRLASRIGQGEWPYETIETGELNAMDDYQVGGILYQTPESLDLSEILGKDAGRLPWRYFAEGPYESESQEFFASFGMSLFWARRLVTELVAGKRLGIAKEAQLTTLIKAVLANGNPDKGPALSPTLESPVVFERGDFCRLVENGKVHYVATELEDSPGAMGIGLVVAAGYQGCRADLAEKLAEFMDEVEIPAGCGVDRSRITVITTQDWQEYRKDAGIFLTELERVGKKTRLASIEELADEQNSDRQIETGFVYNFAYAANFYKDPESYWRALLLKPDRITALLERDDEEILKTGPDQADKLAGQNFEICADEFRRRPGQSPVLNLSQALLEAIYQPNLEKVFPLPEIGKKLAREVAAAADDIYRRNGKDLLVFNDPAMACLTNGKNDLAIFSMPQFQKAYMAYLINWVGVGDSQAQELTAMLKENLAQTFPLIPPTGDQIIDRYVEQGIKNVKDEPNKWILKVVADPELGQLDWGGRGTITAQDGDLTELIDQARVSPLPFVTQQIVPNTPFDSERNDRNQRPIAEDSVEQIAVFDRNPGSLNYGQLVPVASAAARVSPFTLSYRDKTGEVVTDVASGLATIRIKKTNDEGVMTAVHGSTLSVEAPILFR